MTLKTAEVVSPYIQWDVRPDLLQGYVTIYVPVGTKTHLLEGNKHTLEQPATTQFNTFILLAEKVAWRFANSVLIPCREKVCA